MMQIWQNNSIDANLVVQLIHSAEVVSTKFRPDGTEFKTSAPN